MEVFKFKNRVNQNSLLSVIIRTRNSGPVIDRCLNSLMLQKFVLLEFIIVDSASVDDTLSIVKEYQCRIVSFPLNEISFNYSKALNLGIQQAKGDNILIISSHVWLPNSNSLQWMLEYLYKDDSIKAVSLSRSKEDKKLKKEIIKPSAVKITKDVFRGQGMYNYCSLIRREDWKKRAFNENLPTCEDQEWIWYWMKNENASSFILEAPLAGYDNPNYNIAKDVQEYYTMGKYVYSYYGSFYFLKDLYIKAFQNLRFKRFVKFKHYFFVANILFKYKIFPPSSIQSDDYLRK